MIPGNPWDFVLSETLTPELRKNKEVRQAWYKAPATRHCFYSGIEPANPTARVSKANPPRLITAIVADFDLPIPDERVNSVAAAMRIPPSHIERSLGGNVRLVWLLEQPLVVDSFDFCIFVLQAATKWLGLAALPGLDEPAFTDPARLYCNGCVWRSTGAPPIPVADAQAFFVECGRGFRYTPTNSSGAIPLDLVLAAIQEKFPHFAWPTNFEENSQGPSFWIPESTTPLSAIVKPDGMFTFSGHAERPFYSWTDILGSEFTAQFVTRTITAATTEIYWDSKRFWRKIKGRFESLDSPELQNYFKVQCRMSSKPGTDGLSLIDTALDHIYNDGRIEGAAPFIFRPSGLIEYQGRRKLNLYINRVVQPADELTPWGPDGKFPWLSAHFDSLFDPPTQLPPFLAWYKSYYASAYHQKPMPGQNTFLMGGVNTGKTLTNRRIIGASVGGFCDASGFLMGNEAFNSELLEMPHWAVDDETMGGKQEFFQAMLKKTAANQQFHYKKKFEVGAIVEWMGRIVVTTNLDYLSSRALGSMDDSSADKTNIFRCARIGKHFFPNRHELEAILLRELPYFLRWLLEFDPIAAGVKPDARYGYAAHHEPSLLEQAQQGSKSAPFKELLYESLVQFFRENPADADWRGTMTQIVRLLHSNPLNDAVCKSLRLETGQRYLDMIQRDQSIPCRTETGPLGTRIWIFPRFNTEPTPPTP